MFDAGEAEFVVLGPVLWPTARSPRSATPTAGWRSFGIGQNKAMYHAYQRSAGGAWTGWYSLGGAPYASAPFHTSYSPGVGHYHDGSLFVRAWDVDGYKWEKYQLVAGGDWLSGWTGT